MLSKERVRRNSHETSYALAERVLRTETGRTQSSAGHHAKNTTIQKKTLVRRNGGSERSGRKGTDRKKKTRGESTSHFICCSEPEAVCSHTRRMDRRTCRDGDLEGAAYRVDLPTQVPWRVRLSAVVDTCETALATEADASAEKGIRGYRAIAS